MLRLSLALALALPSLVSAQRTVDVTTPAELVSAFGDAMPGDEIVLADGTYMMPRHRLDTTANGTESMRIVVRARNAGRATVRFGDAMGIVEGFVTSHAYWTFEDLVIEGVCDDHSRCEHAWHVVGNAEFLILRNNVARNFNAQIKANRANESDFPDDVLIEGNEFYSETVRNTSNPVTPIDVVGGRRWVIRANYIHDFAKGAGNNISYAAFLKGNGRDGIFERNLVVCEQLHSGQIRLGLSFGGGGSNPDPICEDMDCSIEHQNGIMRNNVIAHCPTDVAIYVNECRDCVITHNTLYEGTGIDLRFATTTDAIVDGNLMSGRIRDRDGATSTRMNNVEMFSGWAAAFADPDALDFSLVDGSAFVDRGVTRAEVMDDFCGNDRDDGMPDIGAVEYDGDGPCDTSTPHPGGPTIPPGADAGPIDPATDAGPLPPDTDAGPISPGTDAGPLPPGTDAGRVTADAGTTEASDDGCGCSAPGAPRHGVLSLLALALLIRRRR